MSDEQIYFNNKTHDRLSELEAKDVLNLQEMKYFMSDVNELKGKYKALLNGMEIQSKEIAELRETQKKGWKDYQYLQGTQIKRQDYLDEQLNELKDVGSARQTEIELESGVKIIQIIEIYDNGHENTFDDVEGYFKRVRDATRKDSGGEKEKKGSTLYGVPLKDYPILQPRETDSKPPEPKCPICDGTGINTHIEKDEIGLNKFAHYPCQCRNEPREDDYKLKFRDIITDIIDIMGYNQDDGEVKELREFLEPIDNEYELVKRVRGATRKDSGGSKFMESEPYKEAIAKLDSKPPEPICDDCGTKMIMDLATLNRGVWWCPKCYPKPHLNDVIIEPLDRLPGGTGVEPREDDPYSIFSDFIPIEGKWYHLKVEIKKDSANVFIDYIQVYGDETREDVEKFFHVITCKKCGVMNKRECNNPNIVKREDLKDTKQLLEDIHHDIEGVPRVFRDRAFKLWCIIKEAYGIK